MQYKTKAKQNISEINDFCPIIPQIRSNQKK